MSLKEFLEKITFEKKSADDDKSIKNYQACIELIMMAVGPLEFYLVKYCLNKLLALISPNIVHLLIVFYHKFTYISINYELKCINHINKYAWFSKCGQSIDHSLNLVSPIIRTDSIFFIDTCMLQS